MLKVNHQELNECVKEYYKKKVALFCWGTFGIGKSFCIRDTAKEIAESRARKFVEWNKLTKEEKQEVYEYPEKYFVLIDIRLSEFDSSDIKGLPNFKSGKETIEWSVPFWAKFTTEDNSDGLLFFDEINLAPPIVMSSCYKIIYDRIVDENKIGGNWLVMGAGNRESDRAFTHTLPAPLSDRGGEVELVTPNVDDWTEWAINNKIDGRIISFVQFKPSNMSNVDFNNNQKFTTIRGLERLSCLIKDMKVNNTFDLLCCSSIGEGIAKEFVAFCKIQDKLKLEQIIKNPEGIKKIDDISTKYFLVGCVAEKYRDKKVNFEKVIEISEVFDEIGNGEFVAVLWKLSCMYSKDFSKDFKNIKGDGEKFIEKYGKYLV